MSRSELMKVDAKFKAMMDDKKRTTGMPMTELTRMLAMEVNGEDLLFNPPKQKKKSERVGFFE